MNAAIAALQYRLNDLAGGLNSIEVQRDDIRRLGTTLQEKIEKVEADEIALFEIHTALAVLRGKPA